MKELRRASRVDDSKVEWEDVTGEFREFEVKRKYVRRATSSDS